MIDYPKCILSNIESARVKNMESFQDAYSEYSMLVEVFNDGTLEETTAWIELCRNDHLAWKSLSRIAAWSLDEHKVRVFFQMLQDDLDALPVSPEKNDYAQSLAQTLCIPIHHPEVAINWLKKNNLTIEHVYQHNPKSLLAACIENPEFVLQCKHKIQLDALLSEPFLYSPDQMRRVVHAFDPHMVDIRDSYRNVMLSNEINSESPGLASWILIHVMHTWRISDIDRLFEPWKTKEKESFLRARSYLSINDPRDPEGAYDFSDDLEHLQQLSYWLYPEYTKLIPSSKKHTIINQTTADIEELFANPKPRISNILKQNLYRHQPQFAHGLFAALEECDKHSGIELAASISNIYKDPQWRTLTLQCRQQDTIEPIAQWLCHQLIPGISWKELRQNVELIKNLNDHWTPEQAWKIALTIREPKVQSPVEQQDYHIDESILGNF